MNQENFKTWINHANLTLAFSEDNYINPPTTNISQLNLQLGVFSMYPESPLLYTIKPSTIKDNEKNLTKNSIYTSKTSLFIFHNKMVLRTKKIYKLDNYVTVITPKSRRFSMRHYQYFDTSDGRMFIKATHPHISSANDPCYGSHKINIYKALSEGDIFMLTRLLRIWFISYNGKDTYRSYKCMNKYNIVIHSDTFYSKDIYYRTKIKDDWIIQTPIMKLLVPSSNRTTSFFKGVKLLIDHYKCSTEEAVYKLLHKSSYSLIDNKLDIIREIYLKYLRLINSKFFKNWRFGYHSCINYECIRDPLLSSPDITSEIYDLPLNEFEKQTLKLFEKEYHTLDNILIIYDCKGRSAAYFKISEEIATSVITGKPFDLATNLKSEEYYRNLHSKVCKIMLSSYKSQLDYTSEKIKGALNA